MRITLPLLMLALLPGAGVAQEVEPHPALTEALAWYTGVAGAVDDERARTLLLEAAADGGVLARMWMARVHSRGRMGFPADRALAESTADSVFPEIRRLADEGVVEAVFLMGTAYDEGLGVEEDPQQAVVWHRRAALAGHVLGSHNLGNQYAAGRGVPQDPAEAVRWWLPAGEAGDAVVQLRLGEAYEAGRGVEADVETALRWYRDAAARGNVQAAEAVERLSR